jgi:TetR/AcrR family transcriptional regulator, ethionamide resistance regulator
MSGKAPRDERRPGVERRLVSAVAELCADGRPFAEVSISELVREAGLGRATFYLYFPDRSAFVLRLSDYIRELLAGPVSALWGAALEDRAVLEAALLDFVTIYSSQYALVAAVVEAAANDPAAKAKLDEGMQIFINESAKVLQKAKKRGLVRAELPAYESAAALVWMTERTCYQLGRVKDPAALKRLAHTLAMIAWHGLRKPAS